MPPAPAAPVMPPVPAAPVPPIGTQLPVGSIGSGSASAVVSPPCTLGASAEPVPHTQVPSSMVASNVTRPVISGGR